MHSLGDIQPGSLHLYRLNDGVQLPDSKVGLKVSFDETSDTHTLSASDLPRYYLTADGGEEEARYGLREDAQAGYRTIYADGADHAALYTGMVNQAVRDLPLTKLVGDACKECGGKGSVPGKRSTELEISVTFPQYPEPYIFPSIGVEKDGKYYIPETPYPYENWELVNGQYVETGKYGGDFAAPYGVSVRGEDTVSAEELSQYDEVFYRDSQLELWAHEIDTIEGVDNW